MLRYISLLGWRATNIGMGDFCALCVLFCSLLLCQLTVHGGVHMDHAWWPNFECKLGFCINTGPLKVESAASSLPIENKIIQQQTDQFTLTQKINHENATRMRWHKQYVSFLRFSTLISCSNNLSTPYNSHLRSRNGCSKTVTPSEAAHKLAIREN